MDETRPVAHLPNLDIGILHRKLQQAALALWAPWLAAARTLPGAGAASRGAKR